MSLIQKEISDFTVQAYCNGSFQTVTKQDVLGKWSVFFFYPADFTFVCPTELEDLAEYYPQFQEAGCEVYSISAIPMMSTKPGTMLLPGSKRFSIQC